MKKHSYLIDVTLLSIVILPYLLLYLGNMPLHTPDEARYSLISLEMLDNKNFLVPTLFGTAFLDKPPLFYYCQLLMIKFFGISEFSLRLPSAIFAWLTCLVIYLTTRKLFCKSTAFFSAGILAATPLFFAMAHYANLDMMVASFVTWSLCFFILAQQKDTNNARSLMWFSYIAIGLAMLSKGLIALVFPVGIITCYSLLYRTTPKLFLLEGLLIILLIAAPWFWLMHNAIPGFSYYYFIIQHFYRYLSHSLNNQQPIWFYVAIVVGCSVPWGGAVISLLIEKWRKTSLNITNRAAWHFFIIAFTFILAFFSIPSSKTIGYILPTLPLLAVILAVMLNSHKTQTMFFVLSFFSLVIGLLLCYPWQQLQGLQHEIMPFAMLLTLSGCLGLFIKLYFASMLPTKQNTAMTQKKAYVLLTVVTMMLLNINGLKFSQSLEFQSIKPIANYIKHHNKEHAPIVMYQQVYYDLGHYAHSENILLVDEWKKGLYKGDSIVEQFALGLQTHASSSFINYEAFSQLVSNHKTPLYIVTDEANAKSLVEAGSQLVLKHHGIYLLYNNKS